MRACVLVYMAAHRLFAIMKQQPAGSTNWPFCALYDAQTPLCHPNLLHHSSHEVSVVISACDDPQNVQKIKEIVGKEANIWLYNKCNGVPIMCQNNESLLVSMTKRLDSSFLVANHAWARRA